VGQPLLFLPFIIMLALYARAAILEERKFADSALKAEYRDYRSRTGFFLPSCRTLMAIEELRR
jgi:protein-S-isoprenylcysteine O-methyltransferase Ste14